jgi:hypothetical protein
MKATYPNDTDYYYQAPSRIQRILEAIGCLECATEAERDKWVKETIERWKGLLK